VAIRHNTNYRVLFILKAYTVWGDALEDSSDEKLDWTESVITVIGTDPLVRDRVEAGVSYREGLR